MLSWLSDRSRTPDMITMLSCLVCDFCRKVMTACDQHVNVIMCRVWLLSENMITLPCWSHAVVTFRQKSYTRHDNINMLVTCCRDFPTEVAHETCRKVMTACDQHVNVIMCRVRLLSESDGSMWTTSWYYHISCHMLSWLSDRSRTPDMITLPCWSHAVVTFR
jgi:small nuclear ribonucleoprotein (snRNP)-like protein